MAGAAQTVSIVATITAVDKKTRDITVKGPQGNEVTFTGSRRPRCPRSPR
jgi:hypothetical protein